MKFSINVPQLAQELRLLNSIAPSKPTVPILGNVLIQASEGAVHLTTTDLELLLQTGCRAQVEEPGMVTVPVKRLLDICEHLPPDAPALFALSDRMTLKVSAGQFYTRLQTRDPEDFPPTPPVNGEASKLDAGALRQTINRIRYAINDKGVSRYTLNGALLSLNETVAAMVATDGKRLALATMPFVGKQGSLLIPSKALDTLSSVFEAGDISMSVGTNHLFFVNGHRMMVSRSIDGQFPAYERIIPRDHQLRAIVNRVALTEAVRRVGLVAEDNGAIYIDFASGVMQLSARHADVGDAAEQIVADYDGAQVRVCCHWEYILHFLEVAAGQNVSIAFQNSELPLLFTDGSNHLSVIMLMRA